MKAALVLALGLATLSSPSMAEPFDSFKRLCLDTQGEPAAVERSARESGWIPDPRLAVQPELSMVRLMDPATADALVPTSLITGRLPAFRGVSSASCSVATPATRDALVDGMNSWAGFNADSTSRGGSIWAFTVTSDGVQRRAELVNANSAALTSAVQSHGTVFLVVLQESASGPVLVQIRIAP